MAVVRDIIIHVEVQVASAKRTCHHNRKEHGIAKGQKCLAIHDGDGARKNYCLLCATAILHKAKTKLLALERDIQS
jgi:hypothetical protein